MIVQISATAYICVCMCDSDDVGTVYICVCMCDCDYVWNCIYMYMCVCVIAQMSGTE